MSRFGCSSKLAVTLMANYKATNMYIRVLSKSVSDALLLFGGLEAEKIAVFVDMFDKWFDAVNTCNFTDGQYQQKPFKNHYWLSATGEEEFRLKVANYFIAVQLRQLYTLI